MREVSGTRVRWVIWTLAAVFLALVPSLILRSGYGPPDDALRHAAFAVADQPWTELLLTRPEIKPAADTHPGWHACLRTVHNWGGWEVEKLVDFSVVFLWMAALLAGLVHRRYPEAWLMALAVGTLVDSGASCRFLLGRPFLLTIAALWTVLAAIDRWSDGKNPRPTDWLWITGASALATWGHSTWYLLVFPLAAGAVKLPRSSLVRISLAVAAGVLLGATLTSDPVRYLYAQGRHLAWTLLDPASATWRAGELRAGPFWQPAFGLALIMILASGWSDWKRVRWQRLSPSPALILIIIGYLFSLVSLRFWTDLGFPAFLFWLAVRLENLLDTIPWKPRGRLLSTILAGLIMVLVWTSNRDGYWSQNPLVIVQRSVLASPEWPAWRPAKNGVIYASEMRAYYLLFAAQPQAHWRYAPGFEPGWMQPADQAVFRRWKATGQAILLAPWAERLTPADRFVWWSGHGQPPAFPGIEWHDFPPFFHVGRKSLPQPP